MRLPGLWTGQQEKGGCEKAVGKRNSTCNVFSGNTFLAVIGWACHTEAEVLSPKSDEGPPVNCNVLLIQVVSWQALRVRILRSSACPQKSDCCCASESTCRLSRNSWWVHWQSSSDPTKNLLKLLDLLEKEKQNALSARHSPNVSALIWRQTRAELWH